MSRRTTSSVTRFGEIFPLGQNLKVFGNFLRVYLVFGKILNLRWQSFLLLGNFSLLSSGQILKKNNLAI